jgi:phosphotriesterase-related protein
MSLPGLSGRVQTVLGPIDPEEVGPTLPHEHVLCDVTPPHLAAAGPEVEITLENVWEIRYHWFRHPGNQRLTDEGIAARELRAFREAGGRTVVELTSGGLRRNPGGLKRVSEASGVNIVMGAGYYTEEYAPAAVRSLSSAQIAAEIVRDVVEAWPDSSIRAGIIGEIGCSWPWTALEQRVMRAAVAAQAATGAAIQIHPGRHPRAPMEIVQFIAAEGGDLRRTVIGHIDRTIFDARDLLDLAATGCMIEYDFFGIESSFYPFADIDLPTDAGRVNAIRTLAREGFADRVLVSHDICTKTRLRTYGGHGYGHILVNVVPIMRHKGLSAREIETILVENPRRLLTLA